MLVMPYVAGPCWYFCNTVDFENKKNTVAKKKVFAFKKNGYLPTPRPRTEWTLVSNGFY